MEIKAYKAEIKTSEVEGKIKGYASIYGNIDSTGDIVQAGAYTRTLKARNQLPLFWAHDKGLFPVGVVRAEEDNRGLKFEGELAMKVEKARDVAELIKLGVVGDVSIGYETIKKRQEQIKGRSVRILEEVKLYEVSLLPVGYAANPEAGLTLMKMRQNLTESDEDKAAATFDDLPMAGMNTPWDAGMARKRIRAWAMDNGDIDWEKYRKAFLWADPDASDTVGGYKLPFADIINGTLKAIPRACMAAGAVMMGSRGGIDIPDSDIKGVKTLLAKYYEKMEMEAPWEKEKSSDPSLEHSDDYSSADSPVAHSDDIATLKSVSQMLCNMRSELESKRKEI